MPLHIFTDNVDFYIAESAEDAVAAWEEFSAEKRDPDEYDLFHQLDDEYIFKLNVEYEDFNMNDPSYPQSAVIEEKGGFYTVGASCRDWCATTGRGLLASMDF